jgi:glyoxylase-like metal-dependent hydrolase (beta-lactamase superfamily II)
VIAGPDTAILVDAICPDSLEQYGDIFKNNQVSVAGAVITHPHPDHYLGLTKPLEKFGGKIFCHFRARERLDRVFSQDTFDTDLRGGEVFPVGGYTVRVIHTPGHSPDHICLYLEEEKILFSGDTVLGFGTTIISPPEGDMGQYMQSLEGLAALDIRLIFPGHGPIIDKRAGERIRWYIRHRQMREQRVIETLVGGRSTPSEIAKRIYTEEDFRMHGRDLLPRAARTVLAHLLKLEKEGIIVSSAGDGETVFELS